MTAKPVAVPRIQLPPEMWEHRDAVEPDSEARRLIDDVWVSVHRLFSYLESNDQVAD